MYRRLATFFVFQSSSEKNVLVPLNYRCPLSEIHHHQISNIVPRTVWFVKVRSVPFFFRSKSEEWPMSFRRFCGVCSNISRIRDANFIASFLSPIDVVAHRHEDDSIFELYGPTIMFPDLFSDFLKQHLEQDWFSINTVQFWTWVLSNSASETKHPKHQSQKTYTFAVDSSAALSFDKVLLTHGIEFQSIAYTPHISWFWSLINFCEMSNKCLILSKSVFLVVRKFSWWFCPRSTATCIVADMNKPQIIMLTSISSMSSSRWRPSFCRLDFLKMANMVWGCCHVVRRRSCTDGTLCRLGNKFPCVGARICMRLPHLRTRCCVLIRVSGCKFLHTREIQIWTPCCKYPQSVRCTRTQRCWRPIDSLRHQIPHWFWFCNHSFIFSRFFLPVSAFSTWCERSWLSWNGWM